MPETVCLTFTYDEPFVMEDGDEYNLPEKINLMFLQDNRTKKMEYMPGVSFNPNERFFSENYFSLTPGFYYVTPIFDEEKNYGYTVSQFNTNNFALYTTYLFAAYFKNSRPALVCGKKTIP